MYKFETKYIISMYSNIKHFNKFKINIEHGYQNISLTVIHIHNRFVPCFLTFVCAGLYTTGLSQNNSISPAAGAVNLAL